ncbi:MAG: GlcG/HbpS family heme-binding protein, partial [Betaproteobacteria bacterium]
MLSKRVLELSDLKRMAGACEALASAQGWAVAFAIVDDGGHLLWLQRLDRAAPISAEIC